MDFVAFHADLGLAFSGNRSRQQSFYFGATPFCQVLFYLSMFQSCVNLWANNVPSTEFFEKPSMLFEDGRTVNIGRKAFEGKMVVPGFNGIILFCHINVL